MLLLLWKVVVKVVVVVVPLCQSGWERLSQPLWHKGTTTTTTFTTTFQSNNNNFHNNSLKPFGSNAFSRCVMLNNRIISCSFVHLVPLLLFFRLGEQEKGTRAAYGHRLSLEVRSPTLHPPCTKQLPHQLAINWPSNEPITAAPGRTHREPITYPSYRHHRPSFQPLPAHPILSSAIASSPTIGFAQIPVAAFRPWGASLHSRAAVPSAVTIARKNIYRSTISTGVARPMPSSAIATAQNHQLTQSHRQIHQQLHHRLDHSGLSALGASLHSRATHRATGRDRAAKGQLFEKSRPVLPAPDTNGFSVSLFPPGRQGETFAYYLAHRAMV